MSLHLYDLSTVYVCVLYILAPKQPGGLFFELH